MAAERAVNLGAARAETGLGSGSAQAATAENMGVEVVAEARLSAPLVGSKEAGARVPGARGAVKGAVAAMGARMVEKAEEATMATVAVPAENMAAAVVANLKPLGKSRTLDTCLCEQAWK